MKNSKFHDMFADVLIAELEKQPNSPYVPFNALEEALRQQIHDYFHELEENIAKGYALSLELLRAKGMDISPYALTKPQLEKLHQEEIMKALAAKEVTLADCFGMGTEELYQLYQIGFDLFNEKKYVEARALFTYLLVLHPQVADFWTALGACFEEMHRDTETVLAFSIAASLKPYLIDSYLPLAKFLLNRGFVEETKHLFEEVIELSKQWEESEESKTLVKEAKKYLESLS